MNWVMAYTLECGCNSGRVHTSDSNKLKPGDLWVCPQGHGDQEIVETIGRGA